MRKIYTLLMFVVLICMTCVCSAEPFHLDGKRWMKIMTVSDSDKEYYIDLKSKKIENEGKIISVWVMEIPKSKVDVLMYKSQLNYTNKTLAVKEAVLRRYSDGKLLEYQHFPENNEVPLGNGTIGEYLYEFYQPNSEINNLDGRFFSIPDTGIRLSIPESFCFPITRKMALNDLENYNKLTSNAFASEDVKLVTMGEKNEAKIFVTVSDAAKDGVKDYRDFKRELLSEGHLRSRFIKEIAGSLKNNIPGLEVVKYKCIPSDDAIFILTESIFKNDEGMTGYLVYYHTLRNGKSIAIIGYAFDKDYIIAAMNELFASIEYWN